MNYYVDMEVACYNYEGIDAVKNALRAGLDMSTEDMPVKVNISFIFSNC